MGYIRGFYLFAKMFVETFVRVVFFAWMGLHAFGEWFVEVVPKYLAINNFPVQLTLFVGSLAFSPLPWWTSFFFIFIPVFISIPALVIFFIFFFIFSLAQNVVFI